MGDDDDFKNIEREIAEMQKAEEKIEYALAVQQIVNSHNTTKSFIAHLPSGIKLASSEGHLVDEFYLDSNGFRLAEMVIKLEGETLTVTQGSVVIFEFSKDQVRGEKSFILELSKKIKDLTLKFQHQTKHKIVEAKEKLMQQLKNF